MDAAQPVRPIDTTAEVETPEHVRFDYPLAGPSRRAVAYLIDAMIRAGVVFVVVLVLQLVEIGVGFDGMSTGATLIAIFLLDWFYYVFFETIWSGRSPGKRALRLRVVGQDGRSLTVLDSVLRNLLRAADFLPFGYAVGLVVVSSDPMFRRLGDMVAGTVVVIEDPGRVTAPLYLHPPPTVEEMERLPSRMPVSREELEAIEVFLRRRGTLAPLRELELAEMIAPIFAKRLNLFHVPDPVRLLGLIYARARGHQAVAAPQQQQQHWPQQQGWPQQQAPQQGWQQQQGWPQQQAPQQGWPQQPAPQQQGWPQQQQPQQGWQQQQQQAPQQGWPQQQPPHPGQPPNQPNQNPGPWS